MKRLTTLLLAAICCLSALAQENYTPTEANIQARKEFEDSRFGIFIHWGLYSMMGQGEWVQQNRNINYEEYARLAGGFCPSKFDADEWVSAIKASGARYLTITSRHHDGFSMFHSDATEYNVVDATPFKRDIMGELAKACHEQGISLHFYYSHLDWGRTDYWPRGSTGHGTGRPDGDESSWGHYLDFVDTQLTELLTHYGPIGAIWFDGIWDKSGGTHEEQPARWNLYGQYELIHRLQPSCLVGNNHHVAPFGGEDIQIFERDIPGMNEAGFSGGQEISRLPLETCQTMNDNWGYDINDHNFKSAEYIIRYLVRTAGKGANLLLNIGPRPDGTLPEEAVQRLREIGEWLGTYGDSIYGTQGGCVGEQGWGVTTQRGNTLYVHVLDDSKEIHLPLTNARLLRASVFGTGEKIEWKKGKDGVTIMLPEAPESTPDRVFNLEFKTAPTR